MNESTPASPRVPDKMAGLSTFSLTPDSFLPPQQMGSGQAIRLDYWSCAQPIEERMWNQFRDTFRKLGVRAGCLVTHCAGGHDRAIGQELATAEQSIVQGDGVRRSVDGRPSARARARTRALWNVSPDGRACRYGTDRHEEGLPAG